MKVAASILLGGLLAVVTCLVFLEACLAARVLLAPETGVIAEYRLRGVRADRYEAAIREALDEADTPAARSIFDLATAQRVNLSEDLKAEIAALPAIDPANWLRQAGQCAVEGDFESEMGLLCVSARDAAIGDLVDIVTEGGALLRGETPDYWTFALASAGLASNFTGPGLLAARPTLSLLKGLRKLGKKSTQLVQEMSHLIARSIDTSALKATVDHARAGRLGGARASASRVIDRRVASRISEIVSDTGAILATSGVRAVREVWGIVQSARELQRAVATARTYGTGFVGVIKLLGADAVRVEGLLPVLLSWICVALLWFVGVAVLIGRRLGLLGKPSSSQIEAPSQRAGV